MQQLTFSSNAFIFPVVYFFYPETAYRSLEEMDSIFVKCDSIFTVVGIAKREPRRYGKDGEILINYEETDMARRRSSVATTAAQSAYKPHQEKAQEKDTDNQEYV